jgi:hypothetical protein
MEPASQANEQGVSKEEQNVNGSSRPGSDGSDNDTSSTALLFTTSLLPGVM